MTQAATTNAESPPTKVRPDGKVPGDWGDALVVEAIVAEVAVDAVVVEGPPSVGVVVVGVVVAVVEVAKAGAEEVEEASLPYTIPNIKKYWAGGSAAMMSSPKTHMHTTVPFLY